MRWEYDLIAIKFDEKKHEWLTGGGHGVRETLEKMGDEGWEMVGAVTVNEAVAVGSMPSVARFNHAHWVYFKHPKP